MTLHSTLYRLPVLSLVLLTVGCASRVLPAGLSDILASGWRPPFNQSCNRLSTPKVLPKITDIMNVVAASSALASSSVRLELQPHVVFEVFFDSAGAKTRTRVLETAFGERTTQVVQSSFYDTVAESFSGERRPWGVLVKAAKNEISPFLIDRMEYCSCVLVNRDEIVRALTRIASQ